MRRDAGMSEKRTFFLTDYLTKLGFTTSPSPTLETLAKLQQRHTALFPFQTLTTVMHQPISLSLPDLQYKVIQSAQGGYCYELNLLFAELLKILGYTVEILSAHVIHEPNFIRRAPRTHIFIKAMLDEKAYLIDVGHGGLTPTTPLFIEDSSPQQTPYGIYRVVQHEGDFYLQVYVGETWKTLYGFDLQPEHISDAIVGNWYVSTHPDSHFRHVLMVARTEEGGKRHALLNNRYTLYAEGQPPHHQELSSTNEVMELIEEKFGIYVPDKKMARRAIKRILDVNTCSA